MSRLYGFLATARGMAKDVIAALPNVTYRSGRRANDPGWQRGRRLVYARDGNRYVIRILTIGRNVEIPQQSAAPNGNWDLWMLVADNRRAANGQHRWLARTWRQLRRHGVPNQVRGPFSALFVQDNWPAVSAKWLAGHWDDAGNRIPGSEWTFPLLAGDTHADVIGWDYRPTNTEISNDVDWTPPG